MTDTITIGAPMFYDPNASIIIQINDNDTVRTAGHLTNLISNYDKDRAKYRRQIQALEEYLTENHDTLGANVLEDLCEMFELDLSKDVEVTVTVTFTAMVSVPLNEYDDFSINHYDIDANLDSLCDYDFDVQDCTIDSVDYETS